jgi:tRNA threonylcarbamoyl adenosine modification protein YeaZ
MIEKSGLGLGAADCIFVARGPGSFNGLRVGVSAAKGLAFSLGVPIVGISTLEVTAYSHADTGLPICAVQNAGREEIAAAIYQKKPRKGWQEIASEHITTISGLATRLKEKTVFCGEINEATLVQIKKYFKSQAVIPGPAGLLRRAAYLAELGRQRQEVGKFDNPETLQPIYLRRPPITERKKA